MNHAQKYLAQANRQIAELTVQIARQRVIVKDAFDSGQRSGMAEALLDALEGSLRIVEKHRIFLLSCSVKRPSKRVIYAPRPAALTCRAGRAAGKDTEGHYLGYLSDASELAKRLERRGYVPPANFLERLDATPWERPRPVAGHDGPGLATTHRVRARRDRLTNAWPAAYCRKSPLILP